MGAHAATKGLPLAGPYCTSKIAVHTLIKIIALVPEIIDTPSNRRQMPGANRENWVSPGKIAKKIEELLLSAESGTLISL